MSKDDLSEWMFATLETDPRFVTMEPATAVVWLKLVRIIHRRGPFAAALHPGEWADMAAAFRMPEAELTGHFNTLVSRRLLLVKRDGDKQAVGVPWPPGREAP